jgi:hypothetical protein
LRASQIAAGLYDRFVQGFVFRVRCGGHASVAIIEQCFAPIPTSIASDCLGTGRINMLTQETLIADPSRGLNARLAVRLACRHNHILSFLMKRTVYLRTVNS